jgi:hypothetical protein
LQFRNSAPIQHPPLLASIQSDQDVWRQLAEKDKPAA